MRETSRKLNLFVYEKQGLIFRIMGWIVMLSSVLTVASMVYYYGFNHSAEEKELLIKVKKSFFGVFIINYLVRLFFTLDRKQFFRNTWAEGILLALVLINFFSLLLFGLPLIARIFAALDVEGFEPYYVFIIQCYLLLLVAVEVVKRAHLLGNLKMKPATTFILSFVILVFLGGGMLMMPGVIRNGESIRFIDSLFMSTSASCVTGLTVVDTATFFNTKGHLIIISLIQLGGLGIISFATFFASFMKKGIGLRHQGMMKELFDNESILGAVGMFRKVIIYTFTIELISATLIYNFWGDVQFASAGHKIYYSLFHAISSFCNAGFSLFTNNLYEPILQDKLLLHMAIAATIFFGSLGFPAIRDIFDVRNIRERLNRPWKKWKLSTQIAVYGSFALIILGAVFFYFLEKDNTISKMGMVEAVVASIFQSVTCRTAGYNTVDFSLLGTPILIIMVFLMFIGGSSGSTAGGIKTSSFTVIFSAIIATVTGKKMVTMGRRTISQELIYKAFAVFIFSASFIFINVVILSIAEPNIPIIRLVFEEVSAFATVGLTTGITANLSDLSKMVLIISMFVGRVGVLSLAFSLSVPTRSNAYKYPNSHIMIG